MNNRLIRIQNHRIGPDRPPFIIAEMSGNHNHSLERAFAIVDAVAEAGADALKIQTYTADTMTIDHRAPAFRIQNKASLWRGETLYSLYQKAHTPWEWHQPIFDRCRKKGLIAFSTPFDPSAVRFLEELHVPCYKIASFENIDLPLIRKVAETGKPLIISTGMATAREISEAVHQARRHGCRDLVLLKCTSAYPAPASQSNLRTLPELRRRFRCHVGISDHTLGLDVSLAAIPLGTEVIERHVTLSRKEGGVDSAFSLEPDELRQLVIKSRVVWEALGKVHWGPTASEKGSLRFRRSLYIVQDVPAGDLFSVDNIRAIRPGLGLPPKHIAAFLGKRARRLIRKGTAVHWNLLK
jgi:pseudaminic acid synthase